MNRKVIKSILNSKVKDWVKSIDDPKVRALVEKNTIITGGAIASMLLNEDVKDFDIYFKDKETVLAVGRYYVDKFNRKNIGTNATLVDGAEKKWTSNLDTKKDARIIREIEAVPYDRVKILIQSAGVASEDGDILKEPFEDVYDVISDADDTAAEELEKLDSLPKNQKYRPVFLSSNAITLSDKIQIVIRFYGDPEEIHSNYDFAHCTNYWTSDPNELVLKPEALEALLTKQLIYQGSKYPLCSVIRTRKFIKRGFHINAGQYLKMLFQTSQLDLTDINVLEDQLVGVDSAYFSMLIEGLRSKMDKDPNFKIEDSYVASIIDKIF